MFPILPGSNPSGYNLERSLRFRRSASANLTRTPAGSSSQSLWTWSGWVKRGQLGAAQTLFSAYAFGASDYQTYFGFTSDDKFQFYNTWGGAASLQNLITTQVFRDPSAWYHIVVNVGMAASTFLTAIQIFINGVQVTSFGTSSFTNANQATAVNSAQPHAIGTYATQNTNYFDGYLAEVNFINGSQLLPSSFGSFNPATGVWQPIKYSGAYSTNGYYLPFIDTSALTTSSNVGLGRDYSGNGNYWTTNNISITAGVTYDSMTDVPTLTNATTANYAVLNPLDNGGATVNAANLNWDSGGNQGTRASFFVSSGKYYWEITSTEANLIGEHGVAPATKSLTGGDAFPGSSTGGWGFSNNSGNKSFNGTQTNITTAGTNGDVMMYALNMDTGKIWFGRNGTWFSSGDPAAGTNEAFSSVTGTLSPMTGVGGAAAGSVSYNFGQRPFAYTPPTGFVALNTFNLPTATIVKGNTVFDATLWTGNGVSPRTVVSSLNFDPDFVWVKSRSNSSWWHQLSNKVAGIGNILSTNRTDAELAQGSNVAGYISSTNSTGFAVTAGSSSIGSYNANGDTYVAWQWNAGGAAASNTNGTITSQVSANTSAGFSVVTYTGNASVATVGHGLGVAPKLIIVKSRNATYNWNTYSASLAANQFLRLNTTDAAQTSADIWNNTRPTSSVFSLGNAVGVNGSGDTHVAYCWSEIDGYSKFGSYTGNNNADGTFVYTGFRPSFVMIKGTNVVSVWVMKDDQRANNYNPQNGNLYADLSNAEDTTASVDVDFLSNGFKLRGTYIGTNGPYNYVYMAFAENPFKNALAR